MGGEGSARAREVQRYYQPWLAAFHATSLPQITRQPALNDRKDGHVPQSSKDRALTAFTQLGALRLNVRRCVVTLIDDEWQYILAEATRTLSLMSDEVHDSGDELWLGNAMIPRGQGLSEFAMEATEYVGKGPGNEEFSSPALIIPDITLDDRFKNKAYAGKPVYFYAGVPLIVNQHVIGVFTVTDDEPRDGLSARELRTLVDMATIVMNHLETIKSDRARARGERLIEGIGQFIEGDSPSANNTPRPRGRNPKQDKNDKKSAEDTRNSTTNSGFLGMTVSDANTLARQRFQSEDLSNIPATAISLEPEALSNARKQDENEDEGHPQGQSSEQASTKLKESVVFNRAAAILRKCMRAEGVVFVDASPVNLSKGTSHSHSHRPKSPVFKRAGPVRANGHHPDHPHRDHNALSRTSSSQTQEDGDEFQRRSLERTPTIGRSGSVHYKPHDCQVLAISVRDPATKVDFKLGEDDLRKMVELHPSPHCYSFDRYGRLATGEDSPETPTSPTQHFKKPDRLIPKKNPLLQTLPGARTIVFLPLWDVAKSKIHSCAIMWTTDPTKLLSIQDDFSYLTAYGNAVMNEIARINLRKSDTAKAKFLANISHELRSPLHGILGSIEFLHDTPLDDFQSNMVISVETCGKTLLDTVNHVLDFSKLHNLSTKGSKEPGITQATTSDSSLTSSFDLAIVVEEAVEAVYAGQVFRMANADALEGKGPTLSSSSRAMATRQETKNLIVKGQAERSSAVRLTLNIDNSSTWHVYSQPGAVRRVVMNLLGNSLKYTERGSIHVALELDDKRQEDGDDFVHACLTVTDTGKGMSEDFVRNHAFTAFSQEDSLTSGTGLGLSIIRQIVDSLGGKIDMRSHQGIGTEIKVWLSFCTADPNESTTDKDSENTILRQMQEQTKGNQLCLLGPGITHRHNEAPIPSLRLMPSVEESLRTLVHQWYSMEVISAQHMRNSEADFILYAEPPPIEYLLDQHGQQTEGSEIPIIILTENAFQANSLRANGIHTLTDVGRIIEIIAQPLGPQKLAKVLQRCVQRVRRLEQSEEMQTAEHVQSRSDGNATRIDNANSHIPVAPQRRESIKTGSGSKLQSIKKIFTKSSGASSDEQSSSLPNKDGKASSLDPVLVVDDNAINLNLLSTFIQKTQHPCESATNGQQALDLYKDHARSEDSRFKYIFMDLSMPILNGNEAAKEIRQFEKQSGIKEPAKIIALTGKDDGDTADMAKKAGFDVFLSKPVKFDRLKELLE